MSAFITEDIRFLLGVSVTKISIKMLVIKYTGMIYTTTSGIIPNKGSPLEVLRKIKYVRR